MAYCAGQCGLVRHGVVQMWSGVEQRVAAQWVGSGVVRAVGKWCEVVQCGAM